MIEYLMLEDVLALIDDLRVGPIRDVGLLDSAVHRPQATVFGVDAYLELDQKAAVLLESLVRNHALIDDNLRIGLLATVVFYGLNNIRLEAPNDDANDLVITIASGAITYEEAATHLGNGTDSLATPAAATCDDPHQRNRSGPSASAHTVFDQVQNGARSRSGRSHSTRGLQRFS